MKVFQEEGAYNHQGILGYLKLDVYKYLKHCFSIFTCNFNENTF